MALDSVELDALAAGDDVATDLISLKHYQYVKHAFGADGTANIVTSTATNPLPVALSDVDNAVLDTINTAVVATQAAVEGTLTVAAHAVSITDTSFAVADGNALGEGLLMQGDDGTDRKNINVDATTGDVQVDVTNTVTVDLGANNDVTVTSGAITETNSTAILADTAAIDTATAAINAKLVTGTVIGDVNLGAVDNAVLDTINTAVELIDNAVYVENAALGATPSGNLVMARQDAALTATGSIDDDATPLTVDANGALWVIPSGTVTVAGTVTANPASGTIDTVSTVTTCNLAAETTKVIGTVNVAAAQTIATTNAGTFATQATLQAGTAEFGKLAAGVAEIGNVKNSGTFATQVDGAALTALQLIDNSIIAHDAAATGATGLNVAGARASNSVETITEVANADVSHLATDLTGVLITRPYIATQEHVQYHVVNTAGTELTITGLDAGGVGIHNFITSVIVHNAHASTNGFIQLLDGTGGTPFATFPAPATGGSVINFTQPLKQPTSNTACFWDASAAITTLYVTIIGYQGQG